ncbi:MAG TPA: hypothetical protein PLX06_15310, partial [Fimbriimonadaceae bacterium]|nr:hypothetical protein [Fimbriimonadaceae bacterium]
GALAKDAKVAWLQISGAVRYAESALSEGRFNLETALKAFARFQGSWAFGHAVLGTKIFAMALRFPL